MLVEKDSVRADCLVQHRGHRPVLHEVTFTVRSGVVGVLGPNGAGKTTLLETMCTLRPPTDGTLSVLGYDPGRPAQAREIRRRVGFLPQSFGYPPRFTARDFLEYVAWSKGVPGRALRAAANEALDRVGLTDVAGRQMRKLSGGMVRRAGIAAAIVHRPKLLILDEPTVGLDPRQRVEFRALVRRLSTETPVVLSTHLTDDVTAMCGEVVVLSDGRVVYQGRTDELAALGAGVGAGMGDTPLERGYHVVTGAEGAVA